MYGYTRLDGRLTLGTSDGRWNLDVIGKNLTIRQILNFSTIAPTSPGSYFLAKEETRNLAVQVRFHW